MGIVTEVDDVSEPLSLRSDETPVAGSIGLDANMNILHTLGIDLSKSAAELKEQKKNNWRS